MKTINYDMVIIGGGIAGLWTLAMARTRGINAILFEKGQVGQGQTIASQGIIHGGSKYALAGSISRATNMISDMPETWRKFMLGAGEFQLHGINMLSNTQHLIPSAGIDTQLLSFLGSKSMASHTEKVGKKHLPEHFHQLGIKRSVFRLNEIVLDVRSILNAFMQELKPWIYQYEITGNDISESNEKSYRHRINISGNTIQCAWLVLASGEGNGRFTAATPMQTRPLNMVMMKGHKLPMIYAHFIGRSTKPVLTVTSHSTPDGQVVWYMGGDLAENGVDKNEAEQIDIAKKLLAKLVPGLTIDNHLSFGCYRINRAEPRQNTLTRPDDAFISSYNNIITGWPTKLALAPRFAEKVLAEAGTNFTTIDTYHSLNLPSPDIAEYPWQQL